MGAVEELLRTVSVRVVRTPASAPNCNAHAERFIRSIKAECLDRVVPCERHLRHLGYESSSTTIARNGIIRASGAS